MPQPNILLIVSDQHAQRVAGCYGDAAGVTPNIDRLASEGVVFDNAYCPSPICVPSRASLMTGREPHQLRCWVNDDFLESRVPTFAHALGAVGYRTTLVGRMHFVGPDQTHGFSERLVGDHSPNWPGNPGFDHGALRGTAHPDLIGIRNSGAGTNAYDLKDRDVAAAACEWLRSEPSRRANGETSPFLLTVGFMLPHPPYVADPEDFQAVEGLVPPVRIQPPEGSQDHAWIREWRAPRDIATIPADCAIRARRAYWALVRRLDGLVGQVLDALRAVGRDRDTLVIYTSDHGDHVGERGLFWKHTFYDESAKVPFVMRWPTELASGVRRSHNISLADLAATLAAVAGTDPPGPGHSVMDLAKDPAAPWPDEVVSEYCQGLNDPWSASHITANRMIRRGRYKLCYYLGADPQLFDLVADPQELSDISTDPGHSAIRDVLLERVLDGWNPCDIARQIARNEADNRLLKNWAARTRPPESHRWSLPAGAQLGLTDPSPSVVSRDVV